MSIKENLYNMSRKADFVEEIIKEELTEKEKNKRDKIHKDNLSKQLQAYFYKFFNNTKKSADESILELYSKEKRLDIIIEIAKGVPEDMTYLNTIYEKDLRKISRIFQNNDKFIESQKPKKSFYESCAESMELFEQCQYKQPKTKKDKNGFILFLNMILGLWNKK